MERAAHLVWGAVQLSGASGGLFVVLADVHHLALRVCLWGGCCAGAELLSAQLFPGI